MEKRTEHTCHWTTDRVALFAVIVESCDTVMPLGSILETGLASSHESKQPDE